MNLYLQLFFSFLQVGAFSVGGGYAAMPLIQSQVVDLHHWLSLAEFTDLITIAEMTPGPIAVNSATFVGIRIGGIPGALVATFGCILPSCLIVSLLAYCYLRFKNLSVIQEVLRALRPAVVALIASAGLTILVMVLYGSRGFSPRLQELDLTGAAVFLLALVLLRCLKKNPILVMVLSGLLGLLLHLGVQAFS